jgi:hypothetical protein
VKIHPARRASCYRDKIDVRDGNFILELVSGNVKRSLWEFQPFAKEIMQERGYLINLRVLIDFLFNKLRDIA